MSCVSESFKELAKFVLDDSHYTDDGQYMQALYVALALLTSPDFMKHGRRNNDAVDLTIAFAVLDEQTIDDWNLFCEGVDWDSYAQRDEFKEVWDRVQPYLEKYANNPNYYYTRDWALQNYRAAARYAYSKI